MASVTIKKQLLKEIETHAMGEGKSIADLVEEFLRAELERRRVAISEEQERLLIEGYKEMAEEHAGLAEESVHYVVEVLDPNENWEEYQDE